MEAVFCVGGHLDGRAMGLAFLLRAVYLAKRPIRMWMIKASVTPRFSAEGYLVICNDGPYSVFR
jgi:hypothetical protein